MNEELRMKNDKGKGFANRWKAGLQILYGVGTILLIAEYVSGNVF